MHKSSLPSLQSNSDSLASSETSETPSLAITSSITTESDMLDSENSTSDSDPEREEGKNSDNEIKTDYQTRSIAMCYYYRNEIISSTLKIERSSKPNSRISSDPPQQLQTYLFAQFIPTL